MKSNWVWRWVRKLAKRTLVLVISLPFLRTTDGSGKWSYSEMKILHSLLLRLALFGSLFILFFSIYIYIFLNRSFSVGRQCVLNEILLTFIFRRHWSQETKGARTSDSGNTGNRSLSTLGKTMEAKPVSLNLLFPFSLILLLSNIFQKARSV